MKICTSCKEQKSESEYYLDNSTGKPRAICKACHKIWNKQNYDRNKAAILGRTAEWARQHPELQKRYQAKYHHKPENKPRLALIERQYTARLKLEMILAYGSRCACCHETEQAFLTLDHIERDGKGHRKQFRSSVGIYGDLRRRGWPKDKYRLLCMNCNFATRYGKPCPHSVKRPYLIEMSG